MLVFKNKITYGKLEVYMLNPLLGSLKIHQNQSFIQEIKFFHINWVPE